MPSLYLALLQTWTWHPYGLHPYQDGDQVTATAYPTRGASVTPPKLEARRQPRAWAVGVAVALNAVVSVALWLHHGGLDAIGTPGGPFTAVGQLAGLLGTYAALVEILLMSRIAWLERSIGFDRLAVWHRWTGFSCVTLLLSHAVFITLGYAESANQGVFAQTVEFVRHYPDVLMSIAGLLLFVGVAVSSTRAARRRLKRESWYAIHLYVYLAIALSFAHQLAVGVDFSTDRLARLWWIALYAAVFAAVLGWRIGSPLRFNIRHRLRVLDVTPEADGVVSIYLSGRQLDRVTAQAGQFFLWRFLTDGGWVKAHPFSLSAPPNRKSLRITVKGLGDDTRRMQNLRAGVRVFAEGPYGTFTADRRTRRRVAFIAGGIGITPLRAILEVLPHDPGNLILLYRVVAPSDVAFRDELALLSRERGIDVRLLLGAAIGDDRTDHLGIPALQHHIPDLAQRDVYLCGPPEMLSALRRRLKALNVPRSQIHFERFDY